VRDKFLDVPSLVALIRRHDPAERLSQWLLAPGNAALLGQQAVRLGLRLVSGLSQEEARCISTARAERPFTSIEDLALRAQLDRHTMQQLASQPAQRANPGQRQARQQAHEAKAQAVEPAHAGLWVGWRRGRSRHRGLLAAQGQRPVAGTALSAPAGFLYRA
jgi:hypothetical protein